MHITGKVWKYGDDINTDVIFPGKYTYSLLDEAQMALHALEDLDQEFNKHALQGDIIVAGKNWGCGSAREQAVKCLKARGVGAIIAKGFSRIYYRNSLNEGLATIVSEEAVNNITAGETISIDFSRSIIITESGEYAFSPYPDFLKGLVENNGLIPYVKKTLKEQGKI